MKSRLIVALMFLYGIAAMAQTTVTAYTPGVSAEGAAYYLPKTAVNISITTVKTSYIPGELCQYADRYLRITGISNKEDCYYNIQSVTLTTEGLPDESKLYNILFAPNSVAPLVSLSESGILQAINVAVLESREAESPISAVEKKAIPLAHSYMTEEMLMAGSKAKLAELVAKEIYNIRESKNLILRSQNEYMPKDAESLQIILAGLEEQEKAFTQLFTGTTATEVITQTYQVVPEESVERIILGRFSRKLGLLHGDDLAGAPIYIDIKSKQMVSNTMVESTGGTIGTKFPKKKTKEKKQDGLVYNIPGKAEVKVYTNTQVLAEERFSFAQFGNVGTLSSNLLTKKKNVRVVLAPATGALLRVEE